MTPIQQRTTTPQRPTTQEGRPDLTSNASGANPTSEFFSLLARSGLHDALGYLNGRTRFRFTGVYRCEPPVLVIESLYDRENPSLEQCGGVRQLDGTFCSIVLATGEVFATGNAPADPRLEGYSARREIISYSGAPIRMPSGRIAGVLCHYDLRLRLLPQGELEVLESVTPYLAHYLETQRPGDPQGVTP